MRCCLKEKGIDNVILPSAILEDNYTKNISRCSEDDSFITIEIDFESITNDMAGYISITEHKTKDTEFAVGQSDIYGEYDSIKQLSLNGMDILVLNNDKESIVEYIDDNIEYSIVLTNCDLDSTIKIAESLE